jgi:hypothetical protein
VLKKVTIEAEAMRFLHLNFILIPDSGHGSDFLLISVKEGGVSLTVSMESGQLDTAIKVRKYIFTINSKLKRLLSCALYLARCSHKH